jgi:hypothetical protein
MFDIFAARRIVSRATIVPVSLPGHVIYPDSAIHGNGIRSVGLQASSIRNSFTVLSGLGYLGGGHSGPFFLNA